MTYEKAVQELYFTLYGTHPTNFHAILYHLIGKADPANLERLRLAYPVEVRAWEDWQRSADEMEFFKLWGPKPKVNQ